MELDTFYWLVPVPKPHDGPVFEPSSDFQAIRQRFPVYDQRMVPGSMKGGRKRPKDAPPFVMDVAQFAVHDLSRPHHFSAEGLADRLVAQAYAQKRSIRFRGSFGQS